MMKKFLLLLTALLLAVLLCACGGKTDDPADEPPQAPADAAPETPDAPEEPEDNALDELREVLSQYLSTVRQAPTYDYGDVGPTPNGVYRYAFVPMEDQAAYPALLLEQDTDFGIGYIRVFQYQAGAAAPTQAEGESIMQGVGEAGGYRGSLSAAGDGLGLLTTELSSGTGEGSTRRIFLQDGTLISDTLWEGNFFDENDLDPTGDTIGSKDIDWHDRSDIETPSGWTGLTDEAEAVQQFLDENPAPDTGASADGPLPTDGDRIVFRATVGTYTREEVVEIQGAPDPNAEYAYLTEGMTYRLLVLDEPQTMNLMGGVEEPRLWEGEVRCVSIDQDTLPPELDGQSVIVSIDPNETWWPTSTDLPLGQPWTGDVHVLG